VPRDAKAELSDLGWPKQDVRCACAPARSINDLARFCANNLRLVPGS
jgi:hypothetical protein